MIVDRCYVCNENAKDTHHINEQCIADENGMIKHFHKNDPHNLAPLCKKCHGETTYGKLIIDSLPVIPKITNNSNQIITDAQIFFGS